MPGRRRKLRWLLIGLAALILLIAARIVQVFFWNPEPDGLPLPIAYDTTRILEPLNPDGTIDYVAALNAMYGADVKPEDNAAIPLIRALGPQAIPEEVRQRVLAALGLESLPEEGEYFKDFEGQREDVDKAGEAPWKRADRPAVAAWLDANEKALALIREAATRPRFFVPLVSTEDPPRLSGLCFPALPFGHPLHAFRALAMMKASAGDVDDAFEDLMAVHRWARLSAQTPLLLSLLVGVSLEIGACRSACSLARGAVLTEQQARAMTARVHALPDLPGLHGAVDHAERLFLLDSTGVFALGRVQPSQADPELHLPIPAAVDWGHAMRVINARLDRLVDAIDSETPKERAAAIQAVEEQFKAGSVRRGEALARAFILGRGELCRIQAEVFAGGVLALETRGMRKICDRKDLANMKRSLAILAMALAAYRAERGCYPPVLSDLVPEYVPAIPADIFSESPLIYRLEGDDYVLYSVGPNGRDDGGREGDGDADDIAVDRPPAHPAASTVPVKAHRIERADGSVIETIDPVEKNRALREPGARYAGIASVRQAPEKDAPGLRRVSIEGFEVLSRDEGITLVRPGVYDCGAAVIQGEKTFAMCWCGGGKLGDHIFHAVSHDGYVWVDVRDVLGPYGGEPRPRDAVHDCDPAMIRVDGVYYLYFTGTDTGDHDNEIFLATSSDGVTWTKHGDTGDPRYPTPVIPNTEPDGGYGIGQSSVIFKDKLFIHYYSNRLRKAGGLWRATSEDGIRFHDHQCVARDIDNADVKYCPELDVFVMAYGEVNDDRIYVNLSRDGIRWPAHDRERTIATSGPENIHHNAAILADEHGHTRSETRVFYGGGISEPGNWRADTWELETTWVRIERAR